MKPRILLLDEPHPKARAIMEEVAECETETGIINREYIGAYVGLSPIPPYLTQMDWKFVACPCTGTDHLKPKKHVKLIYLDDHWKANEGREVTSTSEHTWSLILQLAKMNRMQLKGKRLGIIGFGRIGQQIAKYANSFGMDLALLEKQELKYFTGTEVILLLQQREDFFRSSDIITLHVPLNDETRGLIGEKEFAMMKPGALLVNTSRAEIVDEDALFKWLINDAHARYADDFLYSHASKIQTFGRALLTDHVGGNSLEARESTDLYISKKIVEYLNPTADFSKDGL